MDAKLLETFTGISSALYQVEVAFCTLALQMSKLPGVIINVQTIKQVKLILGDIYMADVWQYRNPWLYRNPFL